MPQKMERSIYSLPKDLIHLLVKKYIDADSFGPLMATGKLFYSRFTPQERDGLWQHFILQRFYQSKLEAKYGEHLRHCAKRNKAVVSMSDFAKDHVQCPVCLCLVHVMGKVKHFERCASSQSLYVWSKRMPRRYGKKCRIRRVRHAPGQMMLFSGVWVPRQMVVINCVVCGAGDIYKWDMRQHYAVCSVRPFSCSGCKKKSTYQCLLTEGHDKLPCWRKRDELCVCHQVSLSSCNWDRELFEAHLAACKRRILLYCNYCRRQIEFVFYMHQHDHIKELSVEKLNEHKQTCGNYKKTCRACNNTFSNKDMHNCVDHR